MNSFLRTSVLGVASAALVVGVVLEAGALCLAMGVADAGFRRDNMRVVDSFRGSAVGRVAVRAAGGEAVALLSAAVLGPEPVAVVTGTGTGQQVVDAGFAFVADPADLADPRAARRPTW